MCNKIKQGMNEAARKIIGQEEKPQRNCCFDDVTICLTCPTLFATNL
jgi:hypothetical protein